MAANFDWLVQIHDHPTAQPQRMQHLNAHLEYNRPQVAAGQLVLSGPMLQHHPASTDDKPAMTGSIMVFRAGSEDAVWQMVRDNPYAKEGVWNLDRATVTPFKCAVRTPL